MRRRRKASRDGYQCRDSTTPGTLSGYGRKRGPCSLPEHIMGAIRKQCGFQKWGCEKHRPQTEKDHGSNKPRVLLLMRRWICNLIIDKIIFCKQNGLKAVPAAVGQESLCITLPAVMGFLFIIYNTVPLPDTSADPLHGPAPSRFCRNFSRKGRRRWKSPPVPGLRTPPAPPHERHLPSARRPRR